MSAMAVEKYVSFGNDGSPGKDCDFKKKRPVQGSVPELVRSRPVAQSGGCRVQSPGTQLGHLLGGYMPEVARAFPRPQCHPGSI